MIFNHFSPPLSDLDLQMVRPVPPGGNWKDIPESVPSKRLDQIRESYRAGKGSRSTYYGRLEADKPSYTITTYFSRPGNGCYIHYDFEGGQHRLISQREAARLQTFPDRFRFFGSKTSINRQIGNAVPPLLALQIAKQLGEPGDFVDLFSGAGGLGLGFSWAGWNALVANDHDKNSLESYSANVHKETVCGDIRDRETFEKVTDLARRAHEDSEADRMIVLGGPPCQGFSTAGNPRTMEDDRNHLFKQYCHALESLDADGFVFENVTGILNMKGGKVFQIILDAFHDRGYETSTWRLQAERYAAPQRRTRVFVVGVRSGVAVPDLPREVTTMGQETALFGSRAPAVTAEEALSDLPPLKPGENGATKGYIGEPRNDYQRLMRGSMSPNEFLDSLGAPPGSRR